MKQVLDYCSFTLGMYVIRFHSIKRACNLVMMTSVLKEVNSQLHYWRTHVIGHVNNITAMQFFTVGLIYKKYSFKILYYAIID